MTFQLRYFITLAVLHLSVLFAANASPANSRLLALVPGGAQIVAGIEDPHNPTSKGRLLLVTHNNNVDFRDWVALTGVDPDRRTDEVIEVATSSAEGELHDHLLLVAGRFDRDRIFRAALENGASTTQSYGQDVLVVQPFARDKQVMNAPRWMAIIDGRTSIFGTPQLVREALDRSLNGSGPDPQLLERLRQLHSDVNSWNVLVMSAPMLARHVSPGQLHAPWTHILDGADELAIGIRYNSPDRIDFVLHATDDSYASSVAGLLAEPRIVRVDAHTGAHFKLQNLSIEGRRVRGSFMVPGAQFDRWLSLFSAGRSEDSEAQSRP